MSQRGKNDNLLIDFNNLNFDGPSASVNEPEPNVNAEILDQNDGTKTPPVSMAYMCASQPLYKLFNTQSPDVDDNNPFDHLDKQAFLSDDPFEMLASDMASSSDLAAARLRVETGMLISIESPLIPKAEPLLKMICDKSKTAPTEAPDEETVQNAEQVQINSSPKSVASPTTGKSRGKAKSTSLNLLKYSLSNSRLDLVADGASSTDDIFSGDETQIKKPKLGCESSTDDSFDDLWATIPNLVDSQTDIDIESDLDNDIAKLNIPMLNCLKTDTHSDEHSTPKGNDLPSNESKEAKAVERSEIRERLASIKQRIPQSPMSVKIEPESTPSPLTAPASAHNHTVDIKRELETSPSTPKSQYSTVVIPQQTPTENTSSLIENLKKLVDQCDDKSKQTTAKHLLDDLSSILSTSNTQQEKPKRVPQPIIRQGTFSIEKNSSVASDDRVLSDIDCSRDSIADEPESSPMDPGLSEVVKQIQTALGQNINVLQTNSQAVDTSVGTAVNPTYIVVMAQPMADYGENDELPRTQRGRSQSLSLKDRPVATVRATPQKSDSRSISSAVSTPQKRPPLIRRSSFGTIILKKSYNEAAPKAAAPIKPEPVKVVRRRSFQGPPPPTKATPEQTPTIVKPLNPIVRRRSFTGPTSTGIRSPSPKTNTNVTREPPVVPRMVPNTTGTLTRRKSFQTDATKVSPTKNKNSFGIMKKPPAPPAARNLKIRVSQGVNQGRTTAPLRAVVPMNRVTAQQPSKDGEKRPDDKVNAPITSTPRSIPSPAKSLKGPSPRLSALPLESPIQKKDSSYVSLTPAKPSSQPVYGDPSTRRRTLSDYRCAVNSSTTVDSNTPGKTVSSIKNATKTLANGLSKFTVKKMTSIGLRRPSLGSKENKNP